MRHDAASSITPIEQAYIRLHWWGMLMYPCNGLASDQPAPAKPCPPPPTPAKPCPPPPPAQGCGTEFSKAELLEILQPCKGW